MADNGTIEIKGLDERIKQLGELSTKNPLMRKRINEVIKQVLSVARRSVSQDAKTGLGMQSDPRQAYKAVRMAVYRRIFGGQINILQRRNAGKSSLYEPPRHPSRVGGNRVQRSARTTALMSYQGADRGFVLRFLNQGTTDRVVHQMGGHNLRTGSTSVIKTKSIGGNRGSITARNWFAGKSQAELEKAAQNLDILIDKIVQGIMY